jgi:hypothetical protein
MNFLIPLARSFSMSFVSESDSYEVRTSIGPDPVKKMPARPRCTARSTCALVGPNKLRARDNVPSHRPFDGGLGRCA